MDPNSEMPGILFDALARARRRAIERELAREEGGCSAVWRDASPAIRRVDRQMFEGFSREELDLLGRLPAPDAPPAAAGGTGPDAPGEEERDEMRENKAAAPGGGRPAGPDEQAAGDRALDRLALAIHGRNGIIKTGKQKCGSSGVLQHPGACAGAPPPTQRPLAAPHASLYGIPNPFTRREITCICVPCVHLRDFVLGMAV